jgi:hypothetical protein
MTLYAPYDATYTSRNPYITSAEFISSPTGVNITQLVPRGTEKQNQDALRNAIARASSWIDQHCRQVLGATLNTASGYYRIQENAYIKLVAANTPIIAVESVKVGYSPSTLTEVPLTNAWIDRKVVTVPLRNQLPQDMLSTTYQPGKVYATMSYVNGYANSLLAAPITAGDTTITVDSNLGLVPGVEITVYDPNFTEVNVVTAVDGNVITVANAYIANHDAGYSVSSLPAAVKQAAVYLTTALVKTRGSEAMVMQQIGSQPSSTSSGERGGMTEIRLAKELLENFIRVV